MIEVHIDPANALCDGAQSLKPSKFTTLMGELKSGGRRRKDYLTYCSKKAAGFSSRGLR